jgi:hypothetical protein
VAQTSIEMNENTVRALDELKTFFGVKSNAAAIRRSIALAQVAMENANEKRQLVIRDPQGKEKTIVMSDGL